MPSLTSKILQAAAVTTSATIATFFVWTKHCHFTDLSPATDPVFQSAFYEKYNPRPNPTAHDLCIRKIPIFKLRPELVEDAERGGTKMVEAFCAGVWGGFGYAIQRHYMTRKYRNTTSTAHQLWTPSQLLASPYDAGTQITDHFEILSKSASPQGPGRQLQSILIRCGDSPLNRDVRASDGLFEVSTEVRVDKGFAEFRLKSVFYQGLGEAEGAPMGSFILWAHRQYTKLLMEDAVRNVRR